MDHRKLDLPHWREHWDAVRPTRGSDPPPPDVSMLCVLGLFGCAVVAAIVADLMRH